ncbi:MULTISPECIES: tRNA pseudouridine(13) synthase TruD [unclassified Luteimonas]|uniref:tRNA pseudouridine(13) synthase TruD n=1 Tax=unclassified Luteimonas TaxID=2629088 RepID=UPI0015FFD49D|nr:MULTISPECIES: tRNA pseudouridine(13) synthase TruD [unclassified Luteimonas]MBB1472513.1 tRNA pseudouridine(13) synthase TruD [Luteimonas sp. MC1782]MBB6598767.1 tRNA pseudouridine(13) synthase TruD [Luteimonas sp. MC1825]QOC88928.1 tRNA pseudouridine(13) synthase TruD [Luteimonas sp. MC1825]
MNDAPPRAHGAPVLRAAMRSVAEDFDVTELHGFEASGAGEHLLLGIEKRGMNTAYVAQRLADWAGVDIAAIGYAGLKDRHAVTRQRFTVHLPRRQAPDIAALDWQEPESGQSLRVTSHAWHSRKLPRGALAGNRFVLRLRDVDGDRAAIGARLQAIAARGVPNYFGEQRFGHGGGNVDKALRMFVGQRVRRDERTLLLSAARSALFNRVLATRVAAASWDRGLEGEAWMLDGSRSVFGPLPWDPTLAARLADFDIHPSASLWGRGELRSEGEARAVELAALEDGESLALRSGLEAAGLKQERRATRLRPGGLAWQDRGDDGLELRFDLPPGTYATTVLAELGVVDDASRRG